VVLPFYQERIQKTVKTAFLVLSTRKHKKQIIMAKANILNSVLTLFFSFWVVTLFAQGDGSAGITEATNMVTSYFDPATRLIYAIGAIVGLIGGVKVYSKFSSGDPDTGKTAAAWFGACIFLIVAATILRSFFL
jgi:hypothetical protein